MDKGLRQKFRKNNKIFSFLVSILGLVDKGLRQIRNVSELQSMNKFQSLV